MQLFYRLPEEVQKPGDDLIIMHGIFGSSDNWLTVSKQFTPFHRVYILDLRNHGRSPHSEEFNYKVMVEDLKEFLEEHKIKDPVILGHSMGGKVAMNFAVAYPELLKKLVVVDIAPKYYRPHHQTILEALTTLDLDSIEKRQDAEEHLTKYIPEVGVRQFLLKNLYRDEDGKFAWRINLPVLNRKIELVGEALAPGMKFNKPTLFIRGGESKYIKDEDWKTITDIFPEAELETIELAGHWVQAEAPNEFAEILLKFLNKS